jgi:ATP-dependent Clp protease adaptor protein ClpS
MADMPVRMKPAPEIKKIESPEEQAALEPLYRVIIHNDNVTPMGFVVVVLVRIFLLDSSEAVHVMYSAHIRGAAHVQTLPRTEAQSRVGKAHFAAGLEGYPLRFTLEPE